MALLITGGGTGGHLAIAQTLGEELAKRKGQNDSLVEVVYVGSISGQDKQWFEIDSPLGDSFLQSPNCASLRCMYDTPHSHSEEIAKSNTANARISSKNAKSDGADTKALDSHKKSIFSATYFLSTSGVVDKRGIAKILSLLHHLKSLKTIRTIFTKHDVKAVISVGGFSAAPASIGAIVFGKPLFIHEQNAIKGRLNALLSPFAKRVFSSFGKNRVPYPIKSQAREKARVRTEIKTIAFIGGSQGARTINHLAISLAPTLLSLGFRIIHQCGQNELESTKAKYAEIGIGTCTQTEAHSDVDNKKLELFGFSTDILSHLESADICIGRAGASSVWENAALGLPMIYVPYPYAASNHQVHNAEFFASKGLGLVLVESKNNTSQKDAQEKARKQAQKQAQIEAMKDRILEYIASFGSSEGKNALESISKSLISLAKQDGAKLIVDEILGELN
ncbi:glycosyltransferase [Helicobacter macacae]|uniref:UDP-N-acetylglucosamine--N-acetylmuramyl-(pentapeptide) pyrophosphoryl-undecaprenol N-acetylglucosamine transferase n=1 Tax=Helicobacter macacae MIT 99-5501 TaxID=1357400 RepID=V8CCQ6_9HELI|nr:glycosyltransferase [Helicobacter macacae]ETD24805.1 hypothetical protein HMPREF2086_00139 [Helicobacter macacae MIT 99-5501]